MVVVVLEKNLEPQKESHGQDCMEVGEKLTT